MFTAYKKLRKNIFTVSKYHKRNFKKDEHEKTPPERGFSLAAFALEFPNEHADF